MKTDIRKIWASHNHHSGHGVVKQRVDDLNQLNCYVGTILISKAKVFCLELDSGTGINNIHLKRFTGVEIQVIETGDDKQELVMILLENELTEIFELFVEDVLNELTKAANSADAIVIISRKVSFWKRLFGKFTGGLLSPQEQRGLYGELFLLKFFLENSFEQIEVIEAWKAPTGTNQDFYFGDVAVEVKTSKSNNPSIKISNEYQLDSLGLKRLYLTFFRLSELPSGANTLLKLIIEIRDLLTDSNAKSHFNLMINYLGISQELELEYDKTSYQIRRIQFFRIEEKFPRITEAMVNEAISHISYEIKPSNCTEYEASSETLLKDIIDAE